jgi:hypothetical protein
MAKLSDEQLRALRILARHPHGCAEAVLLGQGFSHEQIGELVFDKLAMMQRSITHGEARAKIVVLVQITAAGQRAILE